MSRSPEKPRGLDPSPHTSDLTGDFPKNNSRFLVIQEGMDYFEGVVPGDAGDGSFVHDSESHALTPLSTLLLFQPAQLHGRNNWDHWDPANPIRLGSSDRTTTTASEQAANPGATPLSVSLSGVRPRKAFRDSPNNRVGLSSWKQHCDDLWDLHRTMRSKNWASNFHLMPLLQLAAYGMTDVVAVAVGAIEVGDNISRNKAHWARDSTPFLPTSAERVNCGNLTFGFPSATEWKNAMFNKRFFIGVCHFQNHWTSFIFDRVDRHLHHYDTLSVAREERFRTVGLAFREALSSAGLPYTFSAFGLPVTAQPGQWECGYLSVYVMLCNLRGMVGLSGEELRGMKQPTIVKFDQTCIGSPTTSALRHRDWVLTPWVASSSIDLTHVKEFISIAILDELGIKDLTFLDGDTQINMGSGPRRDVRIKGTTLLLPAKNLYTDLGGLQFICWKERPYTHKFYSNRVVMPPTKANQYYRRDSTVPQLPVLFVTLPDQLITRYESRDCTVIDKATPIRKDTQAPASNPTNTTRPKSQNTKQDSHSKGADAENRLSNHTPYAIRT